MTVTKKRCPKCEEVFPLSMQYCPYCNVTLKSCQVEKNTDIYVREEYCPSCHQKIKAGTRNCPNCGEFIAKGSTGNSDENYSSQSGNNTFLYSISVLIPFIGFIAGAILLTSDSYIKKSNGKSCIILGIVSIMIDAIISAILLIH